MIDAINFLIYGVGAIGSIFAGKLTIMGNKVTVLARGKRLAELKSHGIILVNPNTGKQENASVNMI